MRLRPTRPHLPRPTRLLGVATTLVVLAGLAAGCGGSANASGDGTTIRYQTSPGLMNLAEMADALGYLHGITLKNVGVVQGGPQALQALGTGQVDLAGAFVGAAANVIANGTPIKGVIAYYGSDPKVYGGVLAKDGSSFTKPQDLIGKKIAVNTLGAQNEAVLDTWFTKAGMTPDQIKQVTLVPLPSINAEAALRNGQVDAAYLQGSLLVNALKTPGLKVILKDTNLLGSFNGGSYEMTDAYLKDHPDTAKEFVSGMAKAVHWIQTHPVSQVLSTYTKYLDAHGETDDATALATWVGTGIATKGGVLRNGDYTTWTGWLQAQGLLKGSLDVSALYTNQYNPYASGSSAAGSEGN
jgi:ABC-type nitrate/sulfonate/bicarbonate transport system substrate-binding protein